MPYRHNPDTDEYEPCRIDTETTCHCGAEYRGSDHCPDCGCEQYESGDCGHNPIKELSGMHLNTAQRDVASRLSWPVYGCTSSSWDTVLNINGVRIIIYPSGKLDILAVRDSDYSHEAEASIRERFGHLILGHVKTYRH